jgi:hypothetical protein
MSETTMRTEGTATRVDTMAATAVRARKDLPAHHTRMNVLASPAPPKICLPALQQLRGKGTDRATTLEHERASKPTVRSKRTTQRPV